MIVPFLLSCHPPERRSILSHGGKNKNIREGCECHVGGVTGVASGRNRGWVAGKRYKLLVFVVKTLITECNDDLCCFNLI